MPILEDGRERERGGRGRDYSGSRGESIVGRRTRGAKHYSMAERKSHSRSRGSDYDILWTQDHQKHLDLGKEGGREQHHLSLIGLCEEQGVVGERF
jgi:hypothetical protein